MPIIYSNKTYVYYTDSTLSLGLERSPLIIASHHQLYNYSLALLVGRGRQSTYRVSLSLSPLSPGLSHIHVNFPVTAISKQTAVEKRAAGVSAVVS